EVKRKAGKMETVKVKLAEMTDVVPGEKELPEKASLKKARVKPGEKEAPKKEKGEKEKKPETGLLKKQTPALDNTYYLYVPDTYEPDVACTMVIWLHPTGKNKEKDFEDFCSSWTSYAEDRNLIIMCPVNTAPRGWAAGDAEWIAQEVRTVGTAYTL